MASESLADSGTAARRRSRLWRDLARDYQLHLIIALPVIWFIIFKYLPMYGAQIAFRDFAAAKGIWGSPTGTTSWPSSTRSACRSTWRS